MNIKIQQQHPSWVWLAKTRKERTTRRQGRGVAVRQGEKENDGEFGDYRKSGSKSGMINVAPQSRLPRGARAPANYHNHRQRRKWQDCESFQPCARRTNRGLTIWSVHYSPSAADIISQLVIWRHGGKGSASCSLYWVTKKREGKKTRRNVLLRFDFYISACAKEIRSKMMPTTCQKRQHLHLQLSS